MTDKVKITQKEIDEVYEVEQDLTQPKIEDNVDKPETVLNEEEQVQDENLEEAIGWNKN